MNTPTAKTNTNARSTVLTSEETWRALNAVESIPAIHTGVALMLHADLRLPEVLRLKKEHLAKNLFVIDIRSNRLSNVQCRKRSCDAEFQSP